MVFAWLIAVSSSFKETFFSDLQVLRAFLSLLVVPACFDQSVSGLYINDMADAYCF